MIIFITVNFLSFSPYCRTQDTGGLRDTFETIHSNLLVGDGMLV